MFMERLSHDLQIETRCTNFSQNLGIKGAAVAVTDIQFWAERRDAVIDHHHLVGGRPDVELGQRGSEGWRRRSLQARGKTWSWSSRYRDDRHFQPLPWAGVAAHSAVPRGEQRLQPRGGVEASSPEEFEWRMLDNLPIQRWSVWSLWQNWLMLQT